MASSAFTTILLIDHSYRTARTMLTASKPVCPIVVSSKPRMDTQGWNCTKLTTLIASSVNSICRICPALSCSWRLPSQTSLSSYSPMSP